MNLSKLFKINSLILNSYFNWFYFITESEQREIIFIFLNFSGNASFHAVHVLFYKKNKYHKRKNGFEMLVFLFLREGFVITKSEDHLMFWNLNWNDTLFETEITIFNFSKLKQEYLKPLNHNKNLRILKNNFKRNV